jgi:hypothetical protein
LFVLRSPVLPLVVLRFLVLPFLPLPSRPPIRPPRDRARPLIVRSEYDAIPVHMFEWPPLLAPPRSGRTAVE